MTAERAVDAMRILRGREYELDLILTEVHLPDMDKYELLETMGQISSLPIVILSSEDNENAMLGGLFKGAVLYLVKPVTMSDMKNLWQFSYMKKKEAALTSEGINSSEGPSQGNASSGDLGCKSLLNAWGQSALEGKTKELEGTHNDDEEENNDLNISKKPKLVWTNNLNKRFLPAIRILGHDGAQPKKRKLHHMNVPRPSKKNTSIHLQKYRLSLKWDQDAIQKGMIRACQSEFRSFQSNLDGAMSIPSLGSAHYPIPADCNDNDPSIPYKWQVISQSNHTYSSYATSGYGELASQSNLLYSTYTNSSHAGIRIANKGELASFGQMGNQNVKKFLEQRQFVGNVGNSGSENANFCPTLLGNSLLSQQQQQLQQLPQLSPPTQQGQEEHIVFEADRGEIDGLFDMETEWTPTIPW